MLSRSGQGEAGFNPTHVRWKTVPGSQRVIRKRGRVFNISILAANTRGVPTSRHPPKLKY